MLPKTDRIADAGGRLQHGGQSARGGRLRTIYVGVDVDESTRGS